MNTSINDNMNTIRKSPFNQSFVDHSISQTTNATITKTHVLTNKVNETRTDNKKKPAKMTTSDQIVKKAISKSLLI